MLGNNVLSVSCCFLKNVFVRFLGDLASGNSGNKKLIILIYHRVLDAADPMRPDLIVKDDFDWQMKLLSEYFNVLPLGEAVKKLKNGMLTSRAVAVTFDDGYKDNHRNALPILTKYGLSAIFFVASGYLNGGRMWNDTVIETVCRFDEGDIDLEKLDLGVVNINGLIDKYNLSKKIIDNLKYRPCKERQELVGYLESLVDSLPYDLMMSSDDVKDLYDAGMEIGGHTVTHPILTMIDSVTTAYEIKNGKKQLENIVSDNISIFAYPNGKPGRDYSSEDVETVSNLGFKAAVTTAWGVGEKTSDQYQLPRFTPWDQTPGRFICRLLFMYFKGTASVK